jgi:multidrug resistance efflux pump
MAELHVQRKKNNYWWLWLLVVLIIAAAIYWYMNYYHKTGSTVQNEGHAVTITVLPQNAIDNG